MRSIVILVSSILLAAGCGNSEAPAPAPPPFALENGLKVILHPMPAAEKVALVVLYSVGGLHDPKGQSGLAHLVEHCYVTAAAGSTPARDIQQYVARYGDGWNAQTGDDYTVVACVVPPGALEAELADAAARMTHLGVVDADLEREKPRLAAELDNMYGRIPMLGVRNLGREKVCPYPHRGRKGGLAEEVRVIPLAAVQEHLKRYYKPRCAMLVLAGAFDAASARAAVEKHFGPIPAGDAAPQPPPCPKPILPINGVVETKPLQPGAAATVGLTFAAPPPDSDLFAPFLLLVARLTGRAHTLSAGPGQMPVQYAAIDDPAAVSVVAPLAANEPPEAAIARLEKFVSDAVADPTAATSDRMVAKQQFAFALGLLNLPDAMLAQNVYGVAFALGRRAQMGIDPAALQGAVEAATTEDLQRAAVAIFSPQVRAAMVVVPQ